MAEEFGIECVRAKRCTCMRVHVAAVVVAITQLSNGIERKNAIGSDAVYVRTGNDSAIALRLSCNSTATGTCARVSVV